MMDVNQKAEEQQQAANWKKKQHSFWASPLKRNVPLYRNSKHVLVVYNVLLVEAAVFVIMPPLNCEMKLAPALIISGKNSR